MNKADYEQSLASERFTGKLLKYFKAFHKSSLPSILKYKNETADTDPLKAELFSNFSLLCTLNRVRFQNHPNLIPIRSLIQLVLLSSRYVKYVNRWTWMKVKAPTIYRLYCSLKHKHLYLILSIKYFLKLFELGVFQTSGKQLKSTQSIKNTIKWHWKL